MFGTISNKRKKGILHDANFLSWEGNYNFRRTIFSLRPFPFLDLRSEGLSNFATLSNLASLGQTTAPLGQTSAPLC